MSNHGKTLIRWNINEWTQIAEQFVKLKDDNPQLRDVEIFRLAQQVLPHKRQKGAINHQSLEPEVWGRVLDEAKKKATVLVAKEEPTRVEPEPKEFNLFPQERQEIEKPRPLPIVGKSLLDIISQHVANAVTKAVKEVLTDPDVVETFKSVILDALTTPTTFAPPEPVQEKKEEKPYTGPERRVLRKPRVMVVGLLPIQAESLKREFAGDLDLRFYDAQTNHKILTQQATGSDYAIVMTSFIGHPTEDAVRRGDSPDFRRVAGGPSDCARVFRSIVVDWRVKQK